MNKKKRFINGFTNWLFYEYKVPRIPVKVMYRCDAIGVPVCLAEAFDEDDYAKLRKWAIPIASISIILILAGVFIPSKETLITMKVAELATKENIALTAQQLKEIVDYIINALKELK